MSVADRRARVVSPTEPRNLHRFIRLGILEDAMIDAHAINPEPSSERLSWSQICERYPEQWVALVEMDWNDDTDEFTTARVGGYGRTRGEPFAQLRAAGLDHGDIGHFFTGRVRAHAIDFVR